MGIQGIIDSRREILAKIFNKKHYTLQTLTTKDCKGPQTNMPKNVGSIKT